jgi:hypothetical protein
MTQSSNGMMTVGRDSANHALRRFRTQQRWADLPKAVGQSAKFQRPVFKTMTKERAFIVIFLEELIQKRGERFPLGVLAPLSIVA